MTDYTELKRLAEAATTGPWSVCGEVDSTQGFEIVQDIWNEHGTHTGMDVVVYEWSYESDPLGVIRRPDADFIAAANPAAVLALIAENERLTTQVRLAGVSAEVTVHQEVGQAITETLAVTVERDQLKAENLSLHQKLGMAQRDGDACITNRDALRTMLGLVPGQNLHEHVEALRKDAERYRWLRERDLETIHQGGVFAGATPENLVLNGNDLDDRIDSAMGKGEQS